MEDIELQRGPATMWLNGPASGHENKPFVQLRWLPGTQEPCNSFSVTVDGGTQDANRQTAIDLAERILLPNELGDRDLPGAQGPGPMELAGTDWYISDAVAGSDGGIGGIAIELSFGDTTVTWDDGCATTSADYVLDRDEEVLILTNAASTDPGCTPTTIPDVRFQPWPAIDDVMGSERIPATYDLDVVHDLVRLRLGDYPDGSYIILDPR